MVAQRLVRAGDSACVRRSVASLARGTRRVLLLCVAAALIPLSTRAQPQADDHVRHALIRWNQIAIDASGRDHTYPTPGETRRFGEQLGPGRASRAMAIVHLAMFEVVNVVVPQFERRLARDGYRRPLSLPLALSQAAHDTLVALYPSQAPQLHAHLADDVASAVPGEVSDDARRLGAEVAATALARRTGDGSEIPEPRVGEDYAASEAAGHWRPDPVSQSPLALGAHWDAVRPFVLRSADQFRVPPPPAMDSDAYADAFNEVRALGGDGVVTPTTRTDEETFAGIYWAYDGMPSLCAPPRLYNQIAVTVALAMNTAGTDLAYLLALVNVAMADAGIAIWESKYHYDVWRPVTGIREADGGRGLVHDGDGNPRTRADVRFLPLGAPASNITGPNFTPPFPSYPSGHAGFGGALFQTLRRFYGRDDVTFTFVSDEFNGITVDNLGAVRPLRPRTFTSFSAAEEENGQSRIYLGIHWAFDKTTGIEQGRRVADYVIDHLYAPRGRPHR